MGAEVEAGLGDESVDDDAVDGYGGEPSSLRSVDDEHTHHQRIDLVASGETQADGGDDRDGCRAEGADGGDAGGDGEHDPWDQTDAIVYEFDCAIDKYIDGAVVLGDGEEVGHADQGQEEISWKGREDVVGLHSEDDCSEKECADEGQGSHVDGKDCRDDEHRRKHDE